MALVLIVDDEARTRRAMEKLLRRAGFDVVQASNAFEALRIAHRDSPDLILMDVMIPPLDGLTVLMRLREDPCFLDVPVILVTALRDDHTLMRARDLNVRMHLVKGDFTPQQLIDAVRQHVGAGRSEASK